MNDRHTIHEYLNVICKNNNNICEIKECSGYDESVDEIKVRTVVNNNDLKRGWVGDLSYKTIKSSKLSGENINSFVENTYKDVLLKSVNIFSMDDGIITWEYTFCKN